MNKKLLFIFLFLTIAAGVVFTANATVCHQYTSSSVPPAGYGAVYDVFDAAKRLLLQVDCGTSGATLNVGYGNPSQIIYEEGWKYTGTTWQKIIFSGVAKFESGGVTYPWYVGSATANIPAYNIYTVDPYNDQIRKLDVLYATILSTQSITLSGYTVLSANGLAYNPQTCTVYAILKLQGQSGRHLVTINPATGEPIRRSDKIRKRIIQNPKMPSAQIAEIEGTTKTTVDARRAELSRVLKKEGKSLPDRRRKKQ